VDPRVAHTLEPLAEAWRAEVRTPRARVLVAAAGLIVIAALLIARLGTGRARIVAGAILLLSLAALLALRSLERRQWDQPERVIRRIAGGIDPDRAARAVRALSLIEHEDDAGTSRELARLHVARTLTALPRERILEGAARLGYGLGLLGIVTGLGAVAVGLANFWALLEGADVLVARQNVAPVAMHWFAELDIDARPPDYLHEDEQQLRPYHSIAAPRGTLLTVRGTPTHTGRRLALSDGKSEVPFVDDGSGSFVARWPLAESVELRVVAHFGNVVIPEPERTRVESIADELPIVTLEGAPRRVALSTDVGGDIPIRYEATDDHGLREVHLVLRSGSREERRVLARLDGETRFDRGGHVLRATDSFLKKSHGPIEVRVEAKDNDPITGPKWGASAAITVIPPDVGEPEARRLDALRRVRDAVVDTLAWRLGHDVPSGAKDRASFLAEEVKGGDENADLLERTLSASYVGLRVAGRLAAMLRGQMRKVRDALNREVRAPTGATHTALVRTSERLVLVVDAVVRGLGQRDSREAAKQLAYVAEDLALGASQMQRVAERVRGTARADAAVTVLEGGQGSLTHLGALGRDLGEIVGADLARVARARGDEDLVHAEIAARDLAARLHEPDPSFGAQGGGGGRAGGEAGGGRGTPGDEEEGDDAEQAFNEAAQDLERLAQDHAEELGKVERALNGALSDEELKELSDEAKKHAEAVREATRTLPSVGAGSDSWTNKGAAAREHGEAMARALEQGNPSDAVSAGRSALDALDEAKRAAQHEHWLGMFGPLGPVDRDLASQEADRRLNEARQKLEPEVKWAEERLAQLRKKAAERRAGELSADGEEERRMADRAGDLADKGKGQQALPEPALDALRGAEKAARDAAGSLQRGDTERALERQHDAQRQLETAREALGNGADAERGEGGDRDPASGRADIPGADAHKGPEEFRRRVLHGLGQAGSGREKEAVRRYADGLLR
jgi:hypothetical protein